MGQGPNSDTGRIVLALLAATLAATLAACGTDSGVSAGLPSAGQQYDGPLYVTEGRYGAAGHVVDCRNGVTAGGFERAKVYAEGATSDTVPDALETAYSEGLFLEVPEVELAVAKTEADRVLLTYADDAGAVKVAVVFHDGPGTEGAGGDGWYRESWARCDFSEFPERVAESYYGYQIWRGADGSPALTSEIVSFPGSEHCDWQETTFLSLGDGTRDQALYAEHPQPELVQYMQGEYVATGRSPTTRSPRLTAAAEGGSGCRPTSDTHTWANLARSRRGRAPSRDSAAPDSSGDISRAPRPA